MPTASKQALALARAAMLCCSRPRLQHSASEVGFTSVLTVTTGVNPLDGKLVILSTVQQCILYRILVDIIFWTASGRFSFNLLSKNEK